MRLTWHALLFVVLCFIANLGRAAGQTVRGEPFVRQITLTGLKRTNEDFVRSRLASQVGRPFRPEQAREDRERLDRLGIFSSIEVEPLYREYGVDLDIRVSEVIRYLPYPSFNYTDENGLSFGGGLKFLNLLGRGISGSVSARFGGLTDVEVLLQSPWNPKPSLWYDTAYYYRNRPNTLDDFRENVHEGEFRAGYQVHPCFRIGGRLDYMAMKSDVEGITLSDSGSDWTPGLGVLAEYDTRDLASNPRRGWQNSVDLTQYGGFLTGDGDFVRTNLDFRRYHPIAGRHTVAVFSLTTLQTGTVGKEIPVYRDFHIGGTNSIRGWDLNARRGKNQMINTLEYRFEILKQRSFRVFGIGLYTGIHIAAFGDIGTAWDDSGEFSRNFIGGGGVGVRVLFPFIQMIRLDLGFGQSGKGLIPHFGIRQKAYYQRLRVR